MTIEKRYASKVEKYFNQFYKPQRETTEIELVSLQDEEESANVLRLLKDRIVKDFIVMQGDVLVDIPLDSVIDQHNLNECAVTVVMKELDLTQKSKMPKGEVETYDIFGLSEWTTDE